MTNTGTMSTDIDMSFLMGYSFRFLGTCVVWMMMSISMAVSVCNVTKFDSGDQHGTYRFVAGQPASLSVKVSDKNPLMDSVYWKKGDQFISQDNGIIDKYLENFTLTVDNATGLYELKFRKILPGDAGVYKCSCGNSHFEAAVIVYGCCCQGTVTINNETSKSLPGFINVTSESATTEVYQVDFDAGSVYPNVSSLYASWTCNTCENKAGESVDGSRTVPVTTQPDLGKMFNDVYTVFNYKGVTACFDLIAEGNGQNMMRNGCIAINATSYDTCLIRVSYNTCNVTIVNYRNYSKDCPILNTSATTGNTTETPTTEVPVPFLAILVVTVVIHGSCIGVLTAIVVVFKQIPATNIPATNIPANNMSAKKDGTVKGKRRQTRHFSKVALLVVILLVIIAVIALIIVTSVEVQKYADEIWMIPVATVTCSVGVVIIVVAVAILLKTKAALHGQQPGEGKSEPITPEGSQENLTLKSSKNVNGGNVHQNKAYEDDLNQTNKYNNFLKTSPDGSVKSVSQPQERVGSEQAIQKKQSIRHWDAKNGNNGSVAIVGK